MTSIDQLGVGQPGLYRPFLDVLADWRSRYYHFRALRTGTKRSQPLASTDKLQPAGGNLAAVLLNLRTNHPALFDELRDLVADIVPDAGRLHIRTGSDVPQRADDMRIVFETSHGDLNLKDLGTGVEQLLMTLAVGLT